jgi:hypothetical protein
MVLVKGYMATGGKLRGGKWVDPKPLLGAPAIVRLRKDIARGHMQEGANGRGACA